MAAMHDENGDLLVSESDNIRYGIVRLCSLLFQLFVLTYNLQREFDKKPDYKDNVVLWFAYLTHLSMLLTTAHELIMSLRAHKAFWNEVPLASLLEKAGYLRDAAVTTSLVKSGLYWTLDRSGDAVSGGLFHAGDTAALVLSVFLLHQSYATTPGRVLAPMAGGAVYVFINWLLTVYGGLTNAEGKPLYNALDWNNHPDTALMYAILGVAAFAIPPAAAAGYRALKHSCCPPQDEPEAFLLVQEPMVERKKTNWGEWCNQFHNSTPSPKSVAEENIPKPSRTCAIL